MWFESRGRYLGKNGWWCLSHGTDPSLHIRIHSSEANELIILSLTDYNRVWRCWSTKPTDEQSKAATWDERTRGEIASDALRKVFSKISENREEEKSHE